MVYYLINQGSVETCQVCRGKKEDGVADKKKSNPKVKKSSTAKKTEPIKAKISESQRRENVKGSLEIMERQYPGITETYHRFEEAELPSCSHCGSNDTASVQVGIVWRTIYLAGISKKFKLVPNVSDRKGRYFCNNCEKFFD
jgi:hypothetical protein